MTFLRNHWFDLGFGGAVITLLLTALFRGNLTPLSLVLCLNLAALFLHQFEEYRFPGYFPGMMNSVMFRSDQPDRYPLNSNTALIVNVTVGWIVYLLAAVFAEKAVWLGIATILVSVGNFVAHTFLFNIRGKTFYNPGMATSILLFLPLSVWFFAVVIGRNLATPWDYGIGIVLGILLNVLGILKMIDWLKDRSTTFVFAPRFVKR
jgi:hypothetical protein